MATPPKKWAPTVFVLALTAREVDQFFGQINLQFIGYPVFCFDHYPVERSFISLSSDREGVSAARADKDDRVSGFHHVRFGSFATGSSQ